MKDINNQLRKISHLKIENTFYFEVAHYKKLILLSEQKHEE